jgi:hypothetical protein
LHLRERFPQSDPGDEQDGERGIWIQSARPDRAPVLVAEGDFVTWSPV